MLLTQPVPARTHRSTPLFLRPVLRVPAPLRANFSAGQPARCVRMADFHFENPGLRPSQRTEQNPAKRRQRVQFFLSAFLTLSSAAARANTRSSGSKSARISRAMSTGTHLPSALLRLRRISNAVPHPGSHHGRLPTPSPVPPGSARRSTTGARARSASAA